jgi:hypothetical protein
LAQFFSLRPYFITVIVVVVIIIIIIIIIIISVTNIL